MTTLIVASRNFTNAPKNIRGNLSLFLIKRYIIKTYVEVELEVHAFSIR